MDGTLTVPVLDFHAMRTRTGILTGDLLDAIYAIDDLVEQKRLLDVIDQVEREGNDKLQFQPNLESCLTELYKLSPNSETSSPLSTTTNSAVSESDDSEKMVAKVLQHAAIVTRNSQESLQFFLDKLSHHAFIQMFTMKLSRDFRPYKPAPDPLLHIANRLHIPVQNCLMVGDSYHDIDSAKKTGGMQSCLFTSLDHWDEKHDQCVLEHEPDFVIHDLMDLVDIVKSCNETN